MWKWLLVTLSSVLLLAASGCDMGESKEDRGDNGHGTAAELGELLKRPDAEVVLANLHQMVTAVAASLTAEVPGSTWLPDNEESKTHCGQFGSTWGYRYTSQRYQALVPIPADRWQTASQAVIDTAARFGYSKVGFRTKEPGERALRLEIASDDGYGGQLFLGSGKFANFYAVTGCFLRSKDKQEARDSAPK